MIDDLNEAIRDLLKQEIPIKNGEIEISFDQPKREWSSRLSRPTINLFLYEMQENTKLRQQPGWGVNNRQNGMATLGRQPMRLDLRYMITAWATESEDEYRLLGRTIMALSRYGNLPRKYLPEPLQDQPFDIPIEVAQPTNMQNATDIWSVLDNEIRPAISCNITMAVSPYVPVETPVVRSRQVQFEQTNDLQAKVSDSKNYWSIGGVISSEESLAAIHLTLVERALPVHLRDGGQFTIGHLEAGTYTLEITVQGRKKPKLHSFTVPAPDFEITV